MQETYVRWYSMSIRQQEEIELPGAWLVTVASRICLDLLGSARIRRERYVGEWVPEPLPDRSQWSSSQRSADALDPADRVTLDESVHMAFLVVLESMTPAERVAFILHDVFRYPLPRSPRSSAEARRHPAGWPPRRAAASAARTSPRRRPASTPMSSGPSREPGNPATSTVSSPCSTPT